MSSLNGYDKQHNSFLIPVENTKQTFLAAVPCRTQKQIYSFCTTLVLFSFTVFKRLTTDW